MYKHILLPTDGSPLSKRAIAPAVELAKATGARITAVTVMPESVSSSGNWGFLRTYADGWRMPGTDATPEPPEAPESAHDREDQIRCAAEDLLRDIETAAGAAGVPYEGTYRIHDEPYEAIVELAKERGCDLIAMASHGWRGAKALLLGSETSKVLTHSEIPVLVLRS